MTLLNNDLKQLIKSIQNNTCTCFSIDIDRHYILESNKSKTAVAIYNLRVAQIKYDLMLKTYENLYLYLSKTIENYIDNKIIKFKLLIKVIYEIIDLYPDKINIINNYIYKKILNTNNDPVYIITYLVFFKSSRINYIIDTNINLIFSLNPSIDYYHGIYELKYCNNNLLLNIIISNLYNCNINIKIYAFMIKLMFEKNFI